jgi:hypothetical protein
MRHQTADVPSAKPEEGSLEFTEELIRIRAYRFVTRLKVFARLVKTTTTTATDENVKVCEWYYPHPFSEEPDPLHREERVLATRSWHDPNKVTGRIREA